MNISLSPKQLAKYMDQTLLKPYVTEDQIRQFCEECRKYDFAMAAINSAQTALCHSLLKGSGVHVGAAVGFPLGQTTLEVKVFETERAIAEGADEIDYVVNLVKLKSGDLLYVEEEMRRIVEICRAGNVISKVIFENCYLQKEEMEILCRIAREVGPDFIKTSTGFGTPEPGRASGAVIEDVRLMKSLAGERIRVKAAGGIRTLDQALDMIEAGAERIGTSAGVVIVEELKRRQAIEKE